MFIHKSLRRRRHLVPRHKTRVKLIVREYVGFALALILFLVAAAWWMMAGFAFETAAEGSADQRAVGSATRQVVSVSDSQVTGETENATLADYTEVSLDIWSRFGDASAAPMALATLGVVIASAVGLSLQIRQHDRGLLLQFQPVLSGAAVLRMEWVSSPNRPNTILAVHPRLSFRVRNVGDSPALFTAVTVHRFALRQIVCRAGYDPASAEIDLVPHIAGKSSSMATMRVTEASQAATRTIDEIEPGEEVWLDMGDLLPISVEDMINELIRASFIRAVSRALKPGSRQLVSVLSELRRRDVRALLGPEWFNVLRSAKRSQDSLANNKKQRLYKVIETVDPSMVAEAIAKLPADRARRVLKELDEAFSDGQGSMKDYVLECEVTIAHENVGGVEYFARGTFRWSREIWFGENLDQRHKESLHRLRLLADPESPVAIRGRSLNKGRKGALFAYDLEAFVADQRDRE